MAKKTVATAESEAVGQQTEEKNELEEKTPVGATVEETQEERETLVQQMKIVVLKRFRDKFDHKMWYGAGDEVTFDRERAIDVIERDLAKLKE